MKVAVLGGGVGGLSAAIALTLEGFEVEVYERHSEILQIGAGIVCWPNASFVLDKLGMLKQVAAVGGLLRNMNRFTKHAEPIGSLDISTLNQQMGYSSYSIIRRDLMNILKQRVNELEIKLHFQHDVREIYKSGLSTTDVCFRNGKVVQADLVIGADGRMQSIARQFVTGDNSPIYQKFINWIGVIETQEAIFSQYDVADFWGVGERFGIVPITAKKAYWAGGAYAQKIIDKETASYKAELTALFASWPDPISKIINETCAERINKIYVHDHDPIQVWHRGNVVLLGDAAHSALPTSGQGACQALEDAWHLTTCLKDHDLNMELALRQYQEIRYAKTTAITLGGRALAASIFNPDSEACQQRNEQSKQADFQQIAIGMAKGWSQGLPLN